MPIRHARRCACLSLHQRTVVLGVGGRLDADTAGRLRLFLSMFTVDGGPAELVLDLSGVRAVDEDGMEPIHEADEVMRLRQATLRLADPSSAVAHFLADARCTRRLGGGPAPDAAVPAEARGPVVPAPVDGPSAGRD
ncbi:STAS domain-containing protein [Geodermatophilus sp. CPCC 205506]|uniref:STAS domain-containing protein n=1 Tax=Geodermatophilus sp. CPCC 205506 TaxID=2936596 RepID=UPI003EEB287C